MEVADRIGRTSTSLTTAERRVAEVVLANPQLVAFGTVADLAEGAGSGAATVVRLATKLGFEGFSALQASVQQDLANQLRPAAERIRDPAAHDSLNTHLQLELGNVQNTLGEIDQVALADVVEHLADPARRVYVLSGDASRGVAAQFVGDLNALRASVTLVDGNDVAVRRTVALMEETDVLVTVDLRRYDRWLVDSGTHCCESRSVDGLHRRQRAFASGCVRAAHACRRRRGCRAVRQPRRHAGTDERARGRGGDQTSRSRDRTARSGRGRVAGQQRVQRAVGLRSREPIARNRRSTRCVIAAATNS